MKRANLALALLLLLLLLLGAVACGNVTGAAGTGNSGIRGRVVAGPQCPVEPASGSGCESEPVSTDVIVKGGGGDIVTKVHSGSDGRFEVSLAPGTYVLEPVVSDTGMMSAKPVSVTVKTGQFAHATLTLDTGIR
jgi:hypothetical protein